MSERTSMSAAPQDQVPTPEHKPDPSAPAAPAADPAPAADAPPAAGNPDALLKAFARLCRTVAESSLRMGELATEYVTARMLLSDKVQRAACVKTLADVWQEHADQVITPERVSTLVQLHATHTLLHLPYKGKGVKAPSLRVVRAFARLVERDAGQRAETWRVTAGLEERAAALWCEVRDKGLTGDECEAAVSALAHQASVEWAEAAAKREAERKAAEREAADKKAAADLAAHQARTEQWDADRKAKAEQEQREAAARLEAASKDAAAAALEREAADKKAAKAGDTAAKKATAAAPKAPAGPGDSNGKPAGATLAPAAVQAPKPVEAHQGQNLMAVARQQGKAGLTKDVAAWAAELVTAGDAPDDVLAELLRLLDGHKQLSRPSQRAVQAALVVLTRKDKPAAPPAPIVPPAVAERNGQLATAAA